MLRYFASSQGRASLLESRVFLGEENNTELQYSRMMCSWASAWAWALHTSSPLLIQHTEGRSPNTRYLSRAPPSGMSKSKTQELRKIQNEVERIAQGTQMSYSSWASWNSFRDWNPNWGGGEGGGGGGQGMTSTNRKR